MSVSWDLCRFASPVHVWKQAPTHTGQIHPVWHCVNCGQRRTTVLTLASGLHGQRKPQP